MSCYYYCSEAVPHDAVVWSAICDCGISWSYSLLHMILCLHITADCNSNIAIIYVYKLRKTARIRNRYNQVPHLSQDTKRESNKITINIKNRIKEVSPYHSDNHKAVMNRRKSMINTRYK